MSDYPWENDPLIEKGLRPYPLPQKPMSERRPFDPYVDGLEQLCDQMRDEVEELRDEVEGKSRVIRNLNAQIQAVRDVMNEWNAEADRIFAGEPHERLYYGAAAEALRIALDADR